MMAMMMRYNVLLVFLGLLLSKPSTASGPKQPNDNNKNGDKNPTAKVITPTTCEDTCIDFSTTPSGKVLQHGDYVKYEWYEDYGLIIHATSNYGGYTPDGMVRIYDTSLEDAEDLDLLSPNEACPNNPGHGVGQGGRPNKPGANCEPQGNILIIQEENKHHKPDDNAFGGTISFTFESTVDHVKIGLMDLDGPKAATLTIETANQKHPHEAIPIRGLGDNSIQEEVISVPHMKSVTVSPKNSCGIRFVCFCRNDESSTPGEASTTFVPPIRPTPFTKSSSSSDACPASTSTLEEIKTVLETSNYYDLDLPVRVEHMTEFHNKVRSYLSLQNVPDRDFIYYLWKTPSKSDPRAVSRSLSTTSSERQLKLTKPCADALSPVIAGVMSKALSLFGLSDTTTQEAGRLIGETLVETLDDDDSELAALVQDLKDASGAPHKVAEAVLQTTFLFYGAGGVITKVAEATSWWDWLLVGVPTAAQIVAAASESTNNEAGNLVREMQAPYGVTENDLQMVNAKC